MKSGRRIKRLVSSCELNIECQGPFSDIEISQRDSEYQTMTPSDFMKKYRHHLYTPATITIDGETKEIQLNHCYNPFCKWYAQPQKKYINLKSNPSRYRIVGTNDGDDARIECHDIEDNSVNGIALNHQSATISNWSVAEEIKRLISINTIAPYETEYTFHRDSCIAISDNPFNNPKSFHKRGKSTSNSQKYQCKRCLKMTSVMPSIRENFNYHQKENIILIDFIKDILSRTPVKKTCQKLGIGSSTYYSKMELVYRRCLEFLEVHETEMLKKKSFDKIYLNTDALIYHLNNVRAKGMAKGKAFDDIEKKLPTYLMASSDSKSGYVFRSDIAYDYNFDFDVLDAETQELHCDHSYGFLRKNERYRYPFYPQPPTKNDSQTEDKYAEEEGHIRHRKEYVKGCHVKTSYTAIAHYWLIKELLNVDTWYFISDNDYTIQAAIMRLFTKEIGSKKSHYFTCQHDKNLTLAEAGKKYFQVRNDLNNWATDNGFEELTTTEKARLWYEEFLSNYGLHDYINVRGIDYPVAKKMPFQSPISTKDEGVRWISCLTNTTSLDKEELAKILVNIGNWSTNNFFQELHRCVSILERPLMTARGDGKSYIYANYNPKYAQYMVTIFRTFYNFCWPKKKGMNSLKLTPAQRLGIADKAYNIKDIIYFK